MEDRSAAESLAELLKAQEEAQETISRLQAEIERLESTQADTASPSADDTTERLRLALEEIASLNEALRAVEGELVPEGTRPSGLLDHGSIDSEQLEAIASLAQDIRQPLASIKGYTDLLLNESVGILGSLQVRFLERIDASVERLISMAEDLTHLTAIERGRAGLAQEYVDLGEIIDAAIAYTRAQLSEKNIILRVDLPERLPGLRADRDALQQVLINLLQNAGSATPFEGEIALHARVEENGHEAHVLMQITDSGGGIPQEEITRVFTLPQTSDDIPVEDAGDPSTGLAIAKSLIEAHQGRIWVETEEGHGSTFSVLLPLDDGKTYGPLPEGSIL